MNDIGHIVRCNSRFIIYKLDLFDEVTGGGKEGGGQSGVTTLARSLRVTFNQSINQAIKQRKNPSKSTRYSMKQLNSKETLNQPFF